MSENNSGIVFLGLLTIVFITLKLSNNIDWSWWFILDPLYVPYPIVVVGVVIYVLVKGSYILIKKNMEV